MTLQARIEALTGLGFTARQSAFLVTVLLQGGVCVARQYCEFAGIAFGQRMHELFQRLVARGYARPHFCGRHGARFYHLNSKKLYNAIGAAGHRHQQSMSLGTAVGRLMLLDAVLADPETRWLDTDRAKSARLRGCFVGHAAPGLRDFGLSCSVSIPAELRALPIGIRGDGRRRNGPFVPGHLAQAGHLPRLPSPHKLRARYRSSCRDKASDSEAPPLVRSGPSRRIRDAQTGCVRCDRLVDSRRI